METNGNAGKPSQTAILTHNFFQAGLLDAVPAGRPGTYWRSP